MLMHILDEMRNPHCIPSRVKHNVYMRALHSRDAYAYTARLDLLVLIIVEIHVSVNYKDGYYLYIL